MMKLETLELVREQVENKKIFGLEDCKNLDFKFSIGCETIVAINTNGDRITITSDKQYEHLQRYKSEVKLYDKEVTSCSYILIDEKYNRLIDTKIFYMLGDVIKAYDGVLNLIHSYVRYDHLDDVADELEEEAINITLICLEQSKSIKDFVIILELLLGIELMETVIYLTWDSISEIVDEWNEILADDIISLRNEERVN